MFEMKRMLSRGLFALVFTSVVMSCAPVKNFLDPAGPVYTGGYANSPSEFSDTIKVVSYNIKLGQKLEQAIEEFSQLDELRNADIILLQEMDTEGVKILAERLKYNYVYYPASVHTKHHKEFGNAILSKWPIKDHKKIVLPHENPFRKQKRIAAVATVHIGEYEILAYSVHTEIFWLKNPERIEQIEYIAESVPQKSKYVIVGGDFNTEFPRNVRNIEKVFDEAGFTRVSRGIGSTAMGDPLGLITFEMDHVFTKGLTVVENGKLEEAEASDHLPIWLMLKFAEADTSVALQ
jgi:endonuclease/exonuclease/phosphatase family metal-dependent hydrolase